MSLLATKLTLILIFLSIISLVQAQQPDQVIEFFRHGARGPNNNYDPQWPISELNQLTQVGMVQHYDLGKAIAEKYPHLVADGYDPEYIYVTSSSSQRCIESGVVHVASMFRGLTSTLTSSEPVGLQESLIAEYGSLLSAEESNRGDYVPVRVNVARTGTEKLVFHGKSAGNCPAIQTYINQNLAGSEVTEAWTIFQDPIQETNTYLSGSQVIDNLNEMSDAYDAFMCDMSDGKKLPGGITDKDLLESLNYGQAYHQYLMFQLQDAQKGLTSFNTIQAFMDQLSNFRQGKNPKKLAIFSGHDSNLFSVLSAFGVITSKCLLANYEDHENGQDLSYPHCRTPEFATNIIFEFYNETSNPYVKFYYNDVIVPLCNGQESCSYDDLMSFMRTASQSDNLGEWNIKCGNINDSRFISTGAKIGIGIGAAVGFGIFIIITLWICLKKKAEFSKLKQNYNKNDLEKSEDSAIEVEG